MRVELFDFDGTLADSMPYWRQIDIGLFEQFNAPYTIELFQQLTPLSEEETAVEFQRHGVDLPVEEIIRLKNDFMEDAYLHKISLKPGARAYMDQVKEEGAVLAICSSTAHRLLCACTARLGVQQEFRAIYSASELGYSKADPALYRYICQQLGAQPEELTFYDDNAEAIQGAAAAGVHTVGIYDPASAHRWPLLQQSAQRSIRSFEELLK